MLIAAALSWPSASAADGRVEARRAGERARFSDAEIADGFFKIAFGAELGLRGRVDRIRKFVVPVRIHVASQARPDRRRQLAAIVADIASRIAHIDVALTADRDAANIFVTLVRDRDMSAALRATFGAARARQIARALDPQCLSGYAKDAQYRIRRADVILVVDAGEFTFRDCAYEELLQALGPINDDSSVPWTMFNDNVQLGKFGVYDQYLLNILYDKRIRPGMTRARVRALLPQIMPSVRTFVAQRNGLASP
ncbi:MAG: DUF2927 domain-containing protein [Proteobacteria bacterium]|nr:DUF2927 domain-containing protein [Pseudomonadota bacterium]